MSNLRLEVCVDDAEGLAAAIAGGADRIELCSALDLGGLTPLPGLISAAATAPIPIYAMIRPRAGDFIYSARELDQMRFEIDTVRDAGLAGVVFGANRETGELDRDLLEKLVQHASGLGQTLHRAFDLVGDIPSAIDTAVELGFERILTSGRAPSAMEGLSDLKEICDLASGRIDILPGSGIKVSNVGSILNALPVLEVHASCSAVIHPVNSAAARLGFETGSRRKTDEQAVRALKQALTEYR